MEEHTSAQLGAGKNETKDAVSNNDTTPKVIGIGGIFFFSDNPKETNEWYKENLGLETSQYGASFESRNLNKPEEINTFQWTLFKKGSDYFAPSKKEFMINYRVQNIEGLVKKLMENGTTILDSIATYEYGKFVHILDPEGNKIELWESIDEQRNVPAEIISANDTTAKVNGIGGIFFFSDNPKETKEWYSKNLGLEINEWGSSSFESRNIDKPGEINTLQWTLFKNGSDYFAPSKKEFMINYRVQNIEELVKNLNEKGTTILDSIATYDYGKFVHILDPEGNKIELWEPIY